MTDDRSRRGGDRPNLASNANADHHAHDLALVAAHATGDTSAGEAARAEALLAACAECRELAADIRAVRLATRAMPAPARQRDFRITADQAARLRPATPWGRLAQALVAPRGAGRQLSGALMALGFAGLVVTGLAGGGLLGGVGGPGGATELTSRDATSAAGAPGGASYGAGTQSDNAAGGKQAPGDGTPPGASPMAVGLPEGSIPPTGGDRGPAAPGPSAAPVAPEQAPAAGGPGIGTGERASDGPPQPARDVVAAPAAIPWIPILAALSILALLAGVGLFLARRRVASTR